MKIQKFNESYRGDKIIKLYNNSILHDYYQDKDKYEIKLKESKLILDDKKKEIIKLINEYIKLNKHHFESKYNFNNYVVNDFNYYIDENTKTPKLSLESMCPGKIWLKYDDIEGLLNFLNNPDLYKDTKKYNL